MKRVNLTGIIVGFLFLGLAILFFLWAQINKGSSIIHGVNLIEGVLLFVVIGFFFIYQSIKGQSTSSTFKTDIGGLLGVQSVWTYLKRIVLIILITIIFSFLFASVTIKLANPNSWQNRLACLIHYNCINAQNLDPNSFKPYIKESENYTYDNYWFYFTYPKTWKVEYKKVTTPPDKQTQKVWEFKFEPNVNNVPSPSNLSAPGTMKMTLYKPYNKDGINGFINDVLPTYKNDITIEGRKIGQTYVYYLIPQKGFSFRTQYIVLGTYHTYRMSFSSETPKEVEDKITKYLFLLIVFK